jgi:hypothetical protein
MDLLLFNISEFMKLVNSFGLTFVGGDSSCFVDIQETKFNDIITTRIISAIA